MAGQTKRELDVQAALRPTRRQVKSARALQARPLETIRRLIYGEVLTTIAGRIGFLALFSSLMWSVGFAVSGAKNSMLPAAANAPVQPRMQPALTMNAYQIKRTFAVCGLAGAQSFVWCCRFRC
jgi:hypothetical protein